MNTSFHDGVQFAWDSTSIKAIETCEYKYYLSIVEGWTSPSKSVHLLFGGWYASALEHFHKHLANGMDRAEALHAVVREALISTWEYTPCPHCGGKAYIEATEEQLAAYKQANPGTDWLRFDCEECEATGHDPTDEGKPWQSDHNTKTRENLIRTIIWYIDHFNDDPAKTIIQANGAPAVEYSFSLPVDDGIVLAGHIDRLVEYAHNPYVTDQKTTGATISSVYFKQFSPDTQMSLYTFAGKIIYNIPIKGVIIDAAQIAVGFSRFERGFTVRTDTQLNEWYDQTMYRIQEHQRHARERHYPMNPASCNNFGGCEFREICSRSPEVRKNFLAAEFVQRPPQDRWDPLKRR